MFDRFRPLGSGMLAVALILARPRQAAAAWPGDPLVNLPVCTAPKNQQPFRMIPDGAGGVIFAWEDGRAGGFGFVDIYAQHILASGESDPAWPVNGRALCTAVGDQSTPAIASDGSGGAIVAWQDDRVGDKDIYAQHVLGTGVVDPAWPANGRAVNTGYNYQYDPAIVSDGAHGAIITWTNLDIGPDACTQHVLASGALDPAWPAGGVVLSTDPSSQQSPIIVTDRAGGAIIAWQDLRNGSGNPDVYAQRVLANGIVDPAWPSAGRALCSVPGKRQTARMTTDGVGGAIVVWGEVVTTDHSYSDVYAQHVRRSGVVDPGWPASGRALCANAPAGGRGDPVIVADDAGGCVVAWDTGVDIYAQHLLAGGVTDPAWPVDGRALCTEVRTQDSPTITADGVGGAFVAWNDYRNFNVGDIYAQHALASGALAPAWPVNGLAVSSATSDQLSPAIAMDGAGGAIVAWIDFRGGGNSDIYAQRVQANGQLGGDVVSVPNVDPLAFSLEPARPNPWRGGALTVSFTLPSSATALIEVLDVTGRRVAAGEAKSLGAGRHTLELGAGTRPAPGLYMVCLRQGTSVRMSRVVVIR